MGRPQAQWSKAKQMMGGRKCFGSLTWVTYTRHPIEQRSQLSESFLDLFLPISLRAMEVMIGSYLAYALVALIGLFHVRFYQASIGDGKTARRRGSKDSRKRLRFVDLRRFRCMANDETL